MDRKQWRDHASDYIEGSLPADTARQVHEFLATSPEARLDESALRGLTHQLSDLPEVDPPLFFADNVIARIQREQEEARQKSWRSWLPSFGRLAVGSLAAGGVMAAIAWTFFFPKASKPDTNVTTAGVGVPLSGAPGKAHTNVPVPRVTLSSVKVESQQLKFELSLTNADYAMVLASVPGGPTTGVALGGSEPTTRPLQVPLSSNTDVQAVKLLWTGDATRGEQWLITPLTNLQPASARLSFGLGELALTPDALAELSRRFGQAITVVDVPRSEQRVRFDARNETLDELLKRHLEPLGLSVTRVEDRVVVAAKP